MAMGGDVVTINRDRLTPTKRFRTSGKKRMNRVLILAGRDGWDCRYCGDTLDEHTATIDELTPLVRGGQAQLHNQALACAPCNNAKADRTEDEYWAQLAGNTPASYHAHRRELVRRQQAVLPPTKPRRRQRRSNLHFPLADIWPITDDVPWHEAPCANPAVTDDAS